MTQRWIIIALNIAAIVAVLYTGLFSWFNWFYQEPPLTVNSLLIDESTKTIHIGEGVKVKTDICSKGKNQVHVSAALEDGITWLITGLDKMYTIDKGCFKSSSFFADIPKSIPPDTYRFAGQFEVRVKWFIFSKTRITPFSTDSFKIIK